MDRTEWGEIVGDRGDVAADLRWTLFQAERLIETTRREDYPKRDFAVMRHNIHRVRDCHIALAALWAEGIQP